MKFFDKKKFYQVGLCLSKTKQHRKYLLSIDNKFKIQSCRHSQSSDRRKSSFVKSVGKIWAGVKTIEI